MKGYTENNQVVIETANGTFTMEQDLLALTGTHNLYNSLASGIASKIVDIHDEKYVPHSVILRGLSTVWKRCFACVVLIILMTRKLRT